MSLCTQLDRMVSEDIKPMLLTAADRVAERMIKT